MRLFQNSGLYPAYLPRLAELSRRATSFVEHRDAFLADRFGACHLLLPALNGAPECFMTNGDHETSQRCWAQEHGMSASAELDEILLAQIEHHRTEVFYNLDPMRYSSDFVRRLPGSVKVAIAWRAAPSPRADFAAYDRVVCNFPSILESYRQAGWKAAWFAPAIDPVMASYAARSDRPVDIVFVGGYSRHHRNRAEILEAVADRCGRHKLVFHLDQSRLTRHAESWYGRLLPLARHRRPAAIRRASSPPVFGLGLYESISQAKIVLNGAVDMAGADRGNMRCFESMGCGAMMISDVGKYPPGMEDGVTLAAYANASQAVELIERALAEPQWRQGIADRALDMVRARYDKAQQWQDFQKLVAAC